MNTPAHVAAGGIACQAVLYADARFGGRIPPRRRVWFCGVACVVLGAASHLALDALPHYNWIVYLNWLTGLPFHWLIRDALFGLVVLVPLLYWGRDRFGLVCLTIFAAMYPDLEKVACVDLGLPRQFVIFPGHSTELSGNDWGLPHPWLITLEVCLTLGCLAATYGLSKTRRRTIANPLTPIQAR